VQAEGVQDQCVSKELNTLLTARYVLIDDIVVPPRVDRGRQPVLSDAELITLAVAQALLGFRFERHWIRHVRASRQWRSMFCYLPKQPGCHKRLKAAEPLLCRAIVVLAQHCPSRFDDVWMTDATPVPCAASRETVKRSDLAGHDGYGYCASHSRYYWGFKLYLVCSGDGMPIMWCLAHPTRTASAPLDRSPCPWPTDRRRAGWVTDARAAGRGSRSGPRPVRGVG
jgi:hypothetical protein